MVLLALDPYDKKPLTRPLYRDRKDLLVAVALLKGKIFRIYSEYILNRFRTPTLRAVASMNSLAQVQKDQEHRLDAEERQLAIKERQVQLELQQEQLRKLKFENDQLGIPRS
jgi:hypothetical protein